MYWEDGSVVKTQVNEDLFIYLDGILQQGSYEIRRFSSSNKTDRIAFAKAPKNYEDLYDDDAFPQELRTRHISMDMVLVYTKDLVLTKD